MRDELIASLDSFAVPELTTSGKFQRPDGWWVTASDAVSGLADDILSAAPTAEEANQLVGVMLYDEREALAVGELVTAMGELLDTLPSNATDAQFIAAPAWPGVLTAAKKARAVLGRKD
jgi:hypothetical protein